MNRIPPAVIALAVVAGGAHAQSIQKCVDAAGKVHYQDTPCDVKQKTAATIQRDRAMADPAAIQRAQMDRDRSDRLSANREHEYQAEQERIARAHEAEAHARASAEAEARADARAAAVAPRYPDPYGYGYQPPIVIQERTTINNRIVVPSAPAPRSQTYSGAAPPKK